MNRRDALKGISFGALMLATFGNSIPAPAAEDVSVQDLYRPALKGVFDWEEEIRRCKYGWTDPDGNFMNGFHYFYCNYVQIPTRDMSSDNGRYVWQNPYYRETDRAITQMLWEGKEGKAPMNHIHAGARGTGVHALLELGVGLHNFIFADQAIAFISPSDAIRDHERDIFVGALKKLPPQFLDHKSIHPTQEIVKADRYMQAHFLTTTSVIRDRPRFRGQRLNNVYILSAGYILTHKLVDMVEDVQLSLSFRGNSQPWGGCIMAGTWNGNYGHGHGDFFKGKHDNWLPSTKYFTPATDRHYFLDLKTGKVNHKSAIAEVKKLRERFETDNYFGPQDIIENPLTVKELFTLEPV